MMALSTVGSKRRLWLIGLALALAVLGTARFLATAAPHPPAPVGADLPGEAVPTVPSQRIPYLGAPHEPYNSVPPTSGPHVPYTIAPGVYREEIPDELQVQALAYGHVLVQYAPGTPPDQVQILEGIARRYPRAVVVAPYGKLRRGVALTAWGRLERLDRADPAAITAFVTAFAGR